MGHTLASAVRQIPEGALIVGLADMPWLQPATIREIAEALRKQTSPAIVQPVWQDSPGNPIGFAQDQRQTLLQCTGDQGARALVRQAKSAGLVLELPVTDSGIVKDIDVPKDITEASHKLPDTRR